MCTSDVEFKYTLVKYLDGAFNSDEKMGFETDLYLDRSLYENLKKIIHPSKLCII